MILKHFYLWIGIVMDWKVEVVRVTRVRVGVSRLCSMARVSSNITNYMNLPSSISSLSNSTLWYILLVNHPSTSAVVGVRRSAAARAYRNARDYRHLPCC
jgi:hypothetical protein